MILLSSTHWHSSRFLSGIVVWLADGHTDMRRGMNSLMSVIYRVKASSRLPLSDAVCNSSFDATAISPSFTGAGAPRHSVIPLLPMI